MESAGESAASFPAQFGTSSATKCYGKRGGFGGVISSPFRTYNVNELLRINITPPGRREGEKNVRNLGGEMGRRACFVPASSSASWSSVLSVDVVVVVVPAAAAAFAAAAAAAVLLLAAGGCSRRSESVTDKTFVTA